MNCFQWQFKPHLFVDGAGGRFASGVVEWPFGEALLDVRLKPADHRSSWTGRSFCGELMVGMLW